MDVYEGGLRARPATDDDVPALLTLMADFNRLEGIAFDSASIEPLVRKLIPDATLGLLWLFHASEDASATWGYFVLSWGFDLEWRGRDAMLTELYLAPAFRGRGHGAAAMALVEEAARAGEARALHLAVRAENGAALRVYERAGFAAPKRLLMTKELAEPERSTLVP